MADYFLWTKRVLTEDHQQVQPPRLLQPQNASVNPRFTVLMQSIQPAIFMPKSWPKWKSNVNVNWKSKDQEDAVQWPWLTEGMCLPRLLEPRQRSDHDPLKVLIQACLHVMWKMDTRDAKVAKWAENRPVIWGKIFFFFVSKLAWVVLMTFKIMAYWSLFLQTYLASQSNFLDGMIGIVKCQCTAFYCLWIKIAKIVWKNKITIHTAKRVIFFGRKKVPWKCDSQSHTNKWEWHVKRQNLCCYESAKPEQKN